MSFCTQCGSEYSAGQTFCAACGAPLPPSASEPSSAGAVPGQDSAISNEQTVSDAVAAVDSSPSFETIPASGPSLVRRLLIPIIAVAGVLVLAGAGFLSYWLIVGLGGARRTRL